MNKNEDLVGKFIKQAKTETKITPSASSKKDRVRMGLIVGILTAATYSGLAHAINLIQVLGISLFFHPFGILGNIIYAILVGALVGIANAWSDKAIPSMLIGSVIIVLGNIIYQLFSSGSSPISLVWSTIGIAAVLGISGAIGVMMLVTGLMRWTIDVQLEQLNLKFWSWQRLLPILVLVGISAFAGYLHKMSSQEIIALERTNTLIQEGTLCIPEHSGADHYQLEINNSLTKNFYFDISTYKFITQDQNIVVNIYFGKGQDLSYLVSLGRAPDCIY